MTDPQLDQLNFLNDRPELENALEEVRTNPEAAKNFAVDPEAYLKSKGVSTEGLEMAAMAEGGELSDADLERAAGGQIGVCGGVGAGVCGSVGGDLAE